jgi:hypothetical protein
LETGTIENVCDPSFCLANHDIYYYNDKWQVLCEYGGRGWVTMLQWFIYGNCQILRPNYEIRATKTIPTCSQAEGSIYSITAL